MNIVTVIPLKKGLFQENLTYFSAKDVAPFSIVTIPLRKKNILGLVVSTEKASASKMNIKDMDFNLRKILEIKESSIFLKEYLESAIDASRYFVASKNSAITSLIPAAFREKYDTIAASVNRDAPKTAEKNKIKSEKLLLQAQLSERITSYKTLIRESFALKKSIFIVLPTETDVKNFQEALSKGIEQFAFALHGKLTPKKTVHMFEKIVSMEHPVLIIGTAPFLSIPREDIGTVILERESSPIYKMIGRPHLDLRTFVEIFASKINARLILSDTLLSFETIGRREAEELLPMQNLSFRINADIDISVTGKSKSARTAETEEKKFRILSEESVQAIGETIARNKNVFIFSLRKGLATNTVCRDCRETVVCETCNTPVVLYASKDGSKRIFSCNRCKKALDPDTKCSSCGSWNLVPIGIGTDTVYEEAKKLFPETNIFKLDKESAKDGKGAEKIIKEFEASTGSILIGTEMALFYMKEKVPFSVIASFDSLWSIPNFKMSEKIIQLMISVISKTAHKLIIETKNENDEAILAVKEENLLSFIRKELLERKNLNYPPFKRFIKITHLCSKEETNTVKEKLKEIFREYQPEIFSGFMAKLRDKYVIHTLIRLDPKKWSLPELATGASIDEKLRSKLALLPNTFSVTIDPEDLL